MPNDYDRYVTWNINVPEGVAVPSLEQWGMPVWFPDQFSFYPKNVQWMYAIRNPADAYAFTPGWMSTIFVPAGHWFIWTEGSGYQTVADEHFNGSYPDESGGTQYPQGAIPVVDPGPPPVIPQPETPEEPPQEPEPGEPEPEPEQPPQEPETGPETPEEPTNP